MTQAEVAQELGVVPQTILGYELGDRKLPLDRVEPLAKILRISAEQLLGFEPLPPQRSVRITPRFVRHVETLKRLSASDQRFIIRLAEVVARRGQESSDAMDATHV